MRFLSLFVPLLLAASAQAQTLSCAAPLKPMLRAELFFGRNSDGRLAVSEPQWAAFVDGELTPRFPDGLTVIDSKGQWREGGKIAREPGKVVIIVTADEAATRERIAAATKAYIARFRQKSVGVAVQSVCASFAP